MSADWEIVDTGWSEAVVSRKGDVYRKVGFGVAEEIKRLQWCATTDIPAAELLEYGDDYMITRALPGRSAAEPWDAEDRPYVVSAVAKFARWLHSLPVDNCPFNLRLKSIDFGSLDLRLDKQELIKKHLPTALKTGVPVITHGDFCMPNIFIDPVSFEVTGVIDIGKLAVADFHVDVALALYSLEFLNPQFGVLGAQQFAHEYGKTQIQQKLLPFYRIIANDI